LQKNCFAKGWIATGGLLCTLLVKQPVGCFARDGSLGKLESI
jgi:hypothetical protein